MKRTLLFLIALCSLSVAQAQQPERFSFAADLGTGISLGTPSPTPFLFRASGYYHPTPRWAVGLGAGVSVYDEVLIPLFAQARFCLTKRHKFTPYLECGVGYSVAASSKASGGLFVQPSVGVQWALGGSNRLLLAVGYEMQGAQRVKSYENQLFAAEFCEQLAYNSMVIKVGFMF